MGPRLRVLIACTIVTLLTVAAGLSPAVAGKKSKKKPRTVKTSLYLHGRYQVGDGTENASSIAELAPMSMDSTTPTSPAPKSTNYWSLVHDVECNGTFFFPVWGASVQGTIVDKITATLHFVGPASGATVRIWSDASYGTCTENYVQPIVHEVIAIPAGQSEVKVTLAGLGKVKVGGNLLLEVAQSAFGDPTHHGRILYDSPMSPSRLEFSCLPAKGAKSCTP